MLQVRDLFRLVGTCARYSIQSYSGIDKNLPIRPNNEYYWRKPDPKKFKQQFYNVILHPKNARRYKVKDKTTFEHHILNSIQRGYKENIYIQRKTREIQRKGLGKIKNAQMQCNQKPVVIETKYNPETPNLWRSVKEIYHWKKGFPGLLFVASGKDD